MTTILPSVLAQQMQRDPRYLLAQSLMGASEKAPQTGLELLGNLAQVLSGSYSAKQINQDYQGRASEMAAALGGDEATQKLAALNPDAAMQLALKKQEAEMQKGLDPAFQLFSARNAAAGGGATPEQVQMLKAEDARLGSEVFQDAQGNLVPKSTGFLSTIQGGGVMGLPGRQPLGGPAPAAAAQPPVAIPAGGGSFTDAIRQAESGGRRFGPDGGLLTSPKGALGEMQVMPATARDPGFGITPARDDSPEELARVGREYAQKMLEKYKDPALAAAAYNGGPGRMDAALASGTGLAAMPRESRDYSATVVANLTPTTPKGIASMEDEKGKTAVRAVTEAPMAGAKKSAENMADLATAGPAAAATQGGKNAADRITELNQKRGQSVEALRNLQEALNLNDKAYSGVAATGVKVGPVELPGVPALNTNLGLGNDERSTATTEMANKLAKVSFPQIKEFVGSANISDADRESVNRLQGAMDMNPTARAGIIKDNLAIVQRAQELHDIEQQKLASGQEMTPADFKAYYNSKGLEYPSGRPMQSGDAPAGVDAKIWKVMTPEERALFR